MAIYHLRASVISRSAGRSATAAAAYRCATRIDDERTGLTFDYTGKSGVEHTEILAPDPAPDWVQDRSTLWNSVEVAETRKNSQVAREVRVALPCELNLEQRRELVRDFCQREFVDRGMVADIALHEPGREGDDRNHHAHIMLTTREIDASGFTKKNRDWNKVEVLEGWREAWSRECNAALERAGVEDRVDHRTLEAQRDEARELSASAQERGDEAEALTLAVRAVALDRKPLPQLSPGAWQMKERGHDVPAVSLWREVKAQAVEVRRVAAELAGQVRSWLERATERAVDRFAPPDPATVAAAIAEGAGGSAGAVAEGWRENVGQGVKRDPDPPADLASQLREAWAARGPSRQHEGRGAAGEGGSVGGGDGLSRVADDRSEGRDIEDGRPRDLAAELREAAQGIDRDAALRAALEFQQGRKDEEQRCEDVKRQEREREKAAEERKRQEAEVKRGRGRGRSR
jgi:hypothetical protein